jgi:hypothetical protein
MCNMSILVPLVYKRVPPTSIILVSYLNNTSFSNTLWAKFIVTILIVNKLVIPQGNLFPTD